MKTLLAILLLIPSLSWGLGENIKNNKDAIKEKIQDKVEGVRSNNNKSSVSSANKELIGQFKNNFTSIEDLEEALTSAVKEQGKEKLIEDIQTAIVKKVIVAENLYKKLNDNDLNEIANLLIAIRVLDEMTYLSLVNVKSQFHYAAYQAVHLAVHQACIIDSGGVYNSLDDPHIIFYQTFCE